MHGTEKIKIMKKIITSCDPISNESQSFVEENSIIKLINKIDINSNYTLLVSNIFVFYSDIKTQEITEMGKKYLENLNNKINGL
jgi:hypothetical protein